MPSTVSSSFIRRKKSQGRILAILCFLWVAVFFQTDNATAQTVPVTLQAESFATETPSGCVTNTSGCVTADRDAYFFYSNGYIEDSVNFPVSGNFRFVVTALGDAGGGLWPEMEIRIDQRTIGSVTVDSGNWDAYVITGNISAGIHNLAIAFTNDYYNPPDDRNLYVDKVSVGLSGNITQVRLAWNPVDDAAGYRVYKKTASGEYKPVGTVENVSNPEISLSVSYGKKYFFAVTSYDIYGNESNFSNRVSWPVQVLSPDGGEIITSGSPCLIEWYADSRTETSKLLYTVNGGKSWRPIATLTGSFRSYEWTVPQVLKSKTKCKVKAVLKGAGGVTLGSDVSDAYFTVYP